MNTQGAIIINSTRNEIAPIRAECKHRNAVSVPTKFANFLHGARIPKLYSRRSALRAFILSTLACGDYCLVGTNSDTPNIIRMPTIETLAISSTVKYDTRRCNTVNNFIGIQEVNTVARVSPTVTKDVVKVEVFWGRIKWERLPLILSGHVNRPKVPSSLCNDFMK